MAYDLIKRTHDAGAKALEQHGDKINGGIRMNENLGTIGHGTVILGTQVGECVNKTTGRLLRLRLTLNQTPIVVDDTTGKTYTLSWNKIVGLAEAAGISEEPEPVVQ